MQQPPEGYLLASDSTSCLLTPAPRQTPRGSCTKITQQTLVEALSHRSVGIAQAIELLAAQVIHVRYRQIARLEQQGLGGNVIDIKGQ